MAQTTPIDSERLHMRATAIEDAEALLDIYSDIDLMTLLVQRAQNDGRRSARLHAAVSGATRCAQLVDLSA